MKDNLVADIDPFGDEMSQNGDGVMVTDNLGKVLMINEIAKKIWLLPEKVLKTRDFGAIMRYTAKLLRNPEKFFTVGMKLAKARNQVVRDEVYLKDGRIFDLHTFPMIGADNLIHGRIWYTRDVTEKKATEDLHKLHSLMMENLDEGIVLTKLDGTIVYVNRRFEQIFGYEKGEMVGKKISMVNDPSSGRTQLGTSRRIMKEVERDGRWEGSLENIRKDGTPILTEALVVKIKNTEYGDVCVTIQSDVTERRETMRKLIESEKRHRLFFETSLEAILILVKDGSRVLEANPEACRLFERTREDLLHRKREELVDTTDTRLQKLLRQREETGSYRGGLRIIQKGGCKVECEATSVDFTDPDGFQQTHVVLRRSA